MLLSASTPLCSEGAPERSCAHGCRIFRDVTRFLLIAIGPCAHLLYVWGVRVAGLFTALA